MSDFLQLVEKLSVLLFLVSSMLAMGLTVTPADIIAPLRRLRLVLVVLGLNFLVAPAWAWLLTEFIPLDRGHAIGLLLLGGAAGAPFLPTMIAAARGDLALAASLMVLLTVGTIVFLPFALPLLAAGLQADPWGIARPLLLFILLPLIVGALIRIGRSRSPIVPLPASPNSATSACFWCSSCSSRGTSERCKPCWAAGPSSPLSFFSAACLWPAG
jgi:bile acid:Na+ symporter, BASS family